MATSLQLLHAGESGLQERTAKAAAAGFAFHRVRVVELPATPYLVWELNSLLIRHRCGDHIRVVTGEQVRDYEQAGPLPEILVLDEQAVYEVLYDGEGYCYGAIRSTDPGCIEYWLGFIGGLHADGVDMGVFLGDHPDLRLT